MASLTMWGLGDVQEIAAKLRIQVKNTGLTCALVKQTVHTFDSMHICIMVFEKYYARCYSRVSLTVVIIGEGENITVEAIGSGGGLQPFLSITFGAERDFVRTVRNALKRLGFQQGLPPLLFFTKSMAKKRQKTKRFTPTTLAPAGKFHINDNSIPKK